MSKLLEFAVAAAPRRIAATLGDDQVSFLQCARASAQLANALSHWGVRKQDRILFWSDVSLRAIDLFFATSHLGAIFVPANPAFSRAELDAVIDYVQPAFIIADPAHQDAVAAAARRAGAKLGILGGASGAVAGFDLETALAQASDRVSFRGPSGADPNVMFLTSGSTGRPKGVLLSHRAHWLRSASSPGYDAVAGGRGTACMFPLFHMAGWLMILQAFGRCRAVHLAPQASADALWSIIEKHRPQEFYGIPAVWRRLLEQADRRDGSSVNLALTGTSRVEPDLVEEILSRFPNARTGVFYGSTEMGVSLGIGHDDIVSHPYSVGLPMPNVEARIVDGELLLRSDTMMEGYFRLPDETAEVLHNGWYRSGDLVAVDAGGYYEIVGRSREVIRSGGESIAPSEVEAAIMEFSGIADVAVVGLPHEAWGEVVCAVVVADFRGEIPSLEAIRSHLDGRLAPFKHPRMVYARAAPLPRTPATGQIQRSQVKQELLAAIRPL